jgi:hypothetical protein
MLESLAAIAGIKEPADVDSTEAFGGLLLRHATSAKTYVSAFGNVHNTEHALFTMSWNTTVEEDGIGIIDDLVNCNNVINLETRKRSSHDPLTDERLVLHARSERRIGRLVTDIQNGRFGDGMRSATPDE